jgi:outer membrane protein TolC
VIHDERTPGRWIGHLALSVALTFGNPNADAADHSVAGPPQLTALVTEALANNPEIAAARSELDAARQRVAPAGAFEDPMLELGVINAPLPSLSLRREDMTMTMLGLGQKLPFPGKRELRRDVASLDADGVENAAFEITNQVVRDVRRVFEEVVFNAEAQRLLDRTREEFRILADIARMRHQVGLAVQNDVIDAQTELDRLQAQELTLQQESAALQAELRRLLGRDAAAELVEVPRPALLPAPDPAAQLREAALANRPRLQALQAVVERNARTIELMQREYYPDFDLKLQYGQRDRAPDGMPRDDMVSVTVGVNLPIWRKSRLEPQVAEARAMRSGAESMLAAERLETLAALDAQLAGIHQWRSTAALYQDTLLPQVNAAVTSAMAAYRVGRVDFLTLRQAELRVLEVSTALAEAIARHNIAVADIDLLTGRRPSLSN